MGRRDAHVTFEEPQGTRTTRGLPGTGLGETEMSKLHYGAEESTQRATVATCGQCEASVGVSAPILQKDPDIVIKDARHQGGDDERTGADLDAPIVLPDAMF